jgi:hypothetical protein
MATTKVSHAVASQSQPKLSQEAFAYDPSDSLGDVVKGVSAIAYLMESLADGNNKLDGVTAQGFAATLRHYARQADHFLAAK